MAATVLAERSGRTRRADPRLAPNAAPIAALTIVSAASIPLTPLLWGSPLVLSMMAPRMVFLAAAATQTPLLLFMVLATVRLCLADPFHYRLGAMGRDHLLDGRGVTRWCPGPVHRTLTRFSSRVRRRVDPVWCGRLLLVGIFLRPTGKVLACAGAARQHPGAVAVLDLSGTVAWVAGIYVGTNALF